MATTDETSNTSDGFFDKLGGVFINGLNRKIDNSNNNDVQPSPNSQTGAGQTYVTTSDNGNGFLKAAGTGSSFNIPKPILIGGGLAVISVVVLVLLLRR